MSEGLGFQLPSNVFVLTLKGAIDLHSLLYSTTHCRLSM